MRGKWLSLAAAAVALVLLFGGVTPAFADEAAFSCRTAGEWNALFDRRDRRADGWLAADGIYSIPTANDKTVLIFSDTLIGRSDKNGKTVNAKMPNHTAAVLQGARPLRYRLTFYYGTNGKRRDKNNLFGERYWLFDGVYLNETLYILAFLPSEQMKPLCVRLVSVPVVRGEPQWENYAVSGDIPALCAPSADGRYLYAFGQGITDCTGEDGYVYIYGYRDPLAGTESRDLIVARVKAEDFGDFSRLAYWDGAGWSNDMESSAEIARDVGCEMSCTRLPSGPQEGRYLLVYMHATISGRLAYALGDTPRGPFSEPVFFYDAPEHGAPAANGTDTLYAYNAKAHPALSPADELLISYNVNSTGEQYTTDYHPRFLYLRFGWESRDTQIGGGIRFRLEALLERFFDLFLRYSPAH